MFKQVTLIVLLVVCCASMTVVGQVLPRDTPGVNLNTGYPFGDLNYDREVNVADLNVLTGVILGEEPPVMPVSYVPINEFKAKYWQDARNYVDTITEDEVIHGWVVSSDYSGNIYKMLYIIDESGASLPISINQNKLFLDYPIGQEIILTLKGCWVGKRNGMMELGYPAWYAAGSTWEVTYLPIEIWQQMVTLKGEPDLSKVVPTELRIDEIEGKSDAATMLKYQGMLVTIKDVSFVEADGVVTFAELDRAASRTLVDADGHRLIVRNSNFADFADEILPRGKVDVIGVLGCYGDTWQLYLRDRDDVMGGDSTPVEPVADPVTSLNEGFDSSLPPTWRNVIVSGDKKWYQTQYQQNGYAAVTGYKGAQPPFDSWLITPPLDIKNAASRILSFRTQVAGYGSTKSQFEVYLLNSANPSTATVMVKLDASLATPTSGSPTYSDWVDSGEIDLSAWDDGNYYIGFRYFSPQDVNYATWCLDDVKFGL